MLNQIIKKQRKTSECCLRSLMGKAIAIGFMFSLSCKGLAAEQQLLLSDWQMQDATVVRSESVKGGWYRQNSAKQSEEGKQLSSKSYQMEKQWYKATVPGTILTTLVNCGMGYRNRTL